MFRFLVYSIILTLLLRALLRLWAGVREGLSGGAPSRKPGPLHGVQMERDPICGTFVVPTTAVRLQDRTGVHYFCSDRCRDDYRSRPDQVRGRTA
jgi:YHS domain-containing protein